MRGSPNHQIQSTLTLWQYLSGIQSGGRPEPLKQILDPQPSMSCVLNDLCVPVSCKCMNGKSLETFHCDGLVHVYQFIHGKSDCDTIRFAAYDADAHNTNRHIHSVWWVGGRLCSVSRRFQDLSTPPPIILHYGRVQRSFLAIGTPNVPRDATCLIYQENC